MGSWGMWKKYVSVSERRSNAGKQMDKLKKKGKKIEPVTIEGRQISSKFWGKKWCEHLDSFADYDNRLPRGRTYARNGSICHLSIQQGKCEAIVSGSELYDVAVTVTPLDKKLWDEIKQRCSGKIGSILELLQGKLSDHVMGVVADHKQGLLPKQNEIKYSCSCPDWAGMCKHVAAVFYGIGHRLDTQPELLFQLRCVDPSELVASNLTIAPSDATSQLGDDLGAIFDIDLDVQSELQKSEIPATKKAKAAKPKKSSLKQSPLKLNINTLTGPQLKTLRDEKKLTVGEFAKALDVTPASIYRWEQIPGKLTLNSRSKETLNNFLLMQN